MQDRNHLIYKRNQILPCRACLFQYFVSYLNALIKLRLRKVVERPCRQSKSLTHLKSHAPGPLNDHFFYGGRNLLIG